MSCFQLPLSGSHAVSSIYPLVHEELSTPSLGITKCVSLLSQLFQFLDFQLPLSGSRFPGRKFAPPRLRLSTPSLGITRLREARASTTLLSTPSLGITPGRSSGTSSETAAFNSLSRDHSPCQAAWSMIDAACSFNSLSRDHPKSRCQGPEAPRRLSTPSLGITRACSHAGKSVGSSASFNSLSRDHLDGMRKIVHGPPRTFNSLSRDHKRRILLLLL